MKNCVIEGCGSQQVAKGYCWKHYRRMLRHGNIHSYYENKKELCGAEGCERKHYACGLCSLHYVRLKRTGRLDKVKKQSKNEYVTRAGYIITKVSGRTKAKHVLIAEKALGKHLPIGVEVHHVDGDPSNNNSNNLVICPDGAYHKLLHKRQRALEACGNPGFVKCRFCKQYDSLENMYSVKNQCHPECRSKYYFECEKLKSSYLKD